MEHYRRKRDDPEYMPELPDVGEAGFLLAYLWEIGPVESSGGYSSPVTHREIANWCELTGIELQPWQARFIRALSKDYLEQLRLSEKPGCPEPVTIIVSPSKEKAFEQAQVLKNQLRELAKL